MLPKCSIKTKRSSSFSISFDVITWKSFLAIGRFGLWDNEPIREFNRLCAFILAGFILFYFIFFFVHWIFMRKWPGHPGSISVHRKVVASSFPFIVDKKKEARRKSLDIPRFFVWIIQLEAIHSHLRPYQMIHLYSSNCSQKLCCFMN